jgi:hypothetical protein
MPEIMLIIYNRPKIITLPTPDKKLAVNGEPSLISKSFSVVSKSFFPDFIFLGP